MKNTTNHDNNSDIISAAASIRVAGQPDEEWANPGIFSQPLMGKAAALLAFAGSIAGALTLLHAKKLIGFAAKDCLIGAYYVILFAGALRIAGKLDAKRAALLIASAIVFQTWNFLFFFKLHLAVFVFVFEIWLPIYWLREIPATMKEMGFAKKGMLTHVLTGLLVATVTSAYFAWGMKNYGFELKVEPWKLIVNSAQVFPMYFAIFCFIHIVWNRMKKMGLSPISILFALGILSASLNAPVFFSVGMASGTPPGTYFAGFAAITCMMALATHLTFKKFGSALPATCLFTIMADLLLISGLV